MARRSVLVVGDDASCSTLAADDAESRSRVGPKPLRLALDGLAQDVPERDTAFACLTLQNREIIVLGRDRRASNRHASDASIIFWDPDHPIVCG